MTSRVQPVWGMKIISVVESQGQLEVKGEVKIEIEVIGEGGGA